MKKLTYQNTKPPYEGWLELEGFTLGKEYELQFAGNVRPLTQATTINDNGEEVRVLLHHFLPPDFL